MDFFRVVNFENLQHYKDRTPPWIKLYNDLLDDYNFSCLQDASKLHLLMIFLLASRSENKIPADSRWISNKISATESIDLDALFESGFIELIVEESKAKPPKKNASKPLAKSLQDACLEGETETETEGETELEKINKKFSLDFSTWPQLPTLQILVDWFSFRKSKKAPITQTVINLMATELKLAVDFGYTVDQCLSVQQSAGWQGYKFEWHKNRENSNANSNQHPQQAKLSRTDAALEEYLNGSSGAGGDTLDADYSQVDEDFEPHGSAGLPSLGNGAGRSNRS